MTNDSYNYNGNAHYFMNNNSEPFNSLEVTLSRHTSGFGFRIIGGREEGSQVCVCSFYFVCVKKYTGENKFVFHTIAGNNYYFFNTIEVSRLCVSVCVSSLSCLNLCIKISLFHITLRHL